MRAKIADFEVVETVGAGRHLCRAPTRLGADATVLVTELAPAGSWGELSDLLVRLAAIGDDRMLRLLEAGPADEGFYLASEAAPGGTLLDPSQPMAREELVAAVVAAARAAHAMHEQGLAHGAISPAAVLITDRGPVLAPPPLAGPPGLATKVGPWQELISVDPELLRGEAPSRSSDIWSLGTTLHWALSSRPLFPGVEADPPVTAVQRLLFTRPEADSSLPGAILEVVLRCLEPEPADRPATAAQLADMIETSELTPPAADENEVEEQSLGGDR